MKYYIGRVVINDYESNREYRSDACIAAKSEAQAHQLLHERASQWGGDDVRQKDETSWVYNEGEERGYCVTASSLHEVSPVTFGEMSKFLPSFGDVEAGELGAQTVSAQTKTLARRLGPQLQKLALKVPYGKLLTALAASLGETDWQKLKHKGAPKATSQWFPDGNPYMGPARNADEIEFSARVDAIWLSEGDVVLAAQLLRTTPDSLMDSFKEAMDADTAFCGRHPAWLPEHSLSRDFGAKAEEGRTFTIEVEERGNYRQVTGFVDGRDVVSMSNAIAGAWGVGASSCIPYDMPVATKYLACYEAVFRKVQELRHSLAHIDESNFYKS